MGQKKKKQKCTPYDAENILKQALISLQAYALILCTLSYNYNLAEVAACTLSCGLAHGYACIALRRRPRRRTCKAHAGLTDIWAGLGGHSAVSRTEGGAARRLVVTKVMAQSLFHGLMTGLSQSLCAIFFKKRNKNKRKGRGCRWLGCNKSTSRDSEKRLLECRRQKFGCPRFKA